MVKMTGEKDVFLGKSSSHFLMQRRNYIFFFRLTFLTVCHSCMCVHIYGHTLGFSLKCISCETTDLNHCKNSFKLYRIVCSQMNNLVNSYLVKNDQFARKCIHLTSHVTADCVKQICRLILGKPNKLIYICINYALH